MVYLFYCDMGMRTEKRQFFPSFTLLPSNKIDKADSMHNKLLELAQIFVEKALRKQNNFKGLGTIVCRYLNLFSLQKVYQRFYQDPCKHRVGEFWNNRQLLKTVNYYLYYQLLLLALYLRILDVYRRPGYGSVTDQKNPETVTTLRTSYQFFKDYLFHKFCLVHL